MSLVKWFNMASEELLLRYLSFCKLFCHLVYTISDIIAIHILVKVQRSEKLRYSIS